MKKIAHTLLICLSFISCKGLFSQIIPYPVLDDSITRKPYYVREYVLQNTYIDTVQVPITVYPNVYFLYNVGERPAREAAVKSLHLKELTGFPNKSSFSGHVFYIPPDSVKLVNRKVNIIGNYFECRAVGGVLSRDVTLRFRDGVDSKTTYACLDKYCARIPDNFFKELVQMKQVRVEDMLDACAGLEREKIVKELKYDTWLEADLKLKHIYPKPFNHSTSNIVKRYPIYGDTLLFNERGISEFIDLDIYRVHETDSTFADTLFLLQHDLEYHSTFEMEYETHAVEYVVKDDKIIFYNYTYSWDELFGAPYQNPQLYNTFKQTYVIRRKGLLVELKQEFGMLNSKMRNAVLDKEIKQYTGKKFERLNHN